MLKDEAEGEYSADKKPPLSMSMPVARLVSLMEGREFWCLWFAIY